MNITYRIFFAIFALFSFFTFSCERKNENILPDSLHDSIFINDITDISALAVSELPHNLPENIKEYGHVWCPEPKIPDIGDKLTSFINNITPIPNPAVITSNIDGLSLNTTYNIRAYVKTNTGIVYGNTTHFTTSPDYINRLLKVLNDSLTGRDFGYSFILTKNGQLSGSGYGGLQSRRIEPAGEIPVSLNTRMQSASMTKTLTSITFLQLASNKNIKLTDKIVKYLPPYWAIGPHIDKITFSDLLTHRSGINGLGEYCSNGAFSENNWWGLTALIEKGIKTGNYQNYCYQNANFGLFRVLIPSILGYHYSDPVTDAIETARIYEEYIRLNVFGKTGLTIQNFLNNDPLKPTLGYSHPYEQGTNGFNPGDFSSTTGGYGLYLSASEASKIYSDILSTNSEEVLSTTMKELLLQNGYGNYSTSTPQGKFYYHDGWWYLGLGSNPRGFRSIWVKGPDNITLVLFTNALRKDDGLFPLRSDAYSDITSFVLWAFSSMDNEGKPKDRKENINFHSYLEYPEPH